MTNQPRQRPRQVFENSERLIIDIGIFLVAQLGSLSIGPFIPRYGCRYFLTRWFYPNFTDKSPIMYQSNSILTII